MEVAVLTNRLTSAAFAQTTSYLLAHGRPLDQARFAYLFGDGESEEVLAALASYQNDDGGFGHGLESDLRTTASSAIATAMAGRILREVKAPADAPGIERAIAYLLNNYDTARAVWPIVTERVEDAPHAPWWTYATTAESFDGFRLNPTAELLGMLYDYRSMVPTGVLDSLTATVLERIRSAPDAMEMHDYRSCIVLAETANLPPRPARPSSPSSDAVPRTPLSSTRPRGTTTACCRWGPSARPAARSRAPSTTR